MCTNNIYKQFGVYFKNTVYLKKKVYCIIATSKKSSKVLNKINFLKHKVEAEAERKTTNNVSDNITVQF